MRNFHHSNDLLNELISISNIWAGGEEIFCLSSESDHESLHRLTITSVDSCTHLIWQMTINSNSNCKIFIFFFQIYFIKLINTYIIIFRRVRVLEKKHRIVARHSSISIFKFYNLPMDTNRFGSSSSHYMCRGLF